MILAMWSQVELNKPVMFPVSHSFSGPIRTCHFHHRQQTASHSMCFPPPNGQATLLTSKDNFTLNTSGSAAI
ncbi:hypothetical protein Hamer_G017822 [Homarus americanus]|uniref:Uncharacterized protein n=1 Tax=Homarus americanus TaxID=6706 RepID=A0A8J5TKI2_HOMAM|nr:hypothetical protein Hamer_G017822 [Homarus americanus]